MASKRLKHLQEELWAKQRYVNEMKVLDLIKFLTSTREDSERIYLTEEEFDVILYGLEYFSLDPLLIQNFKQKLTDENLTKNSFSEMRFVIKN